MTGLPAKYAKLGFAKGWKAYRTAGKKRPTRKARKAKTTKKRKSSIFKFTPKKRRKAAIMAKRNKGGKMNMANEIQSIGIGAAGAIGGNMLSNIVPIQDVRIKAAIPLIAGIVLSMSMGKKSALMKKIGMGMSIGGAMSIVRAFMPNMALLAGEEAPALTYTPADVEQALITGEITPQQAQILLDSPATMGETEEFAGEEEALEYSSADGWETTNDSF